jgi:multidrug resistance protein MdtO
MAESATDRLARSEPRWRELLQATPEQLGFAARLALICALTAALTAIYQTPDPALTAYCAFFLNRPERTTSLILSIAFTIVITVVIGLVFLAAKGLADEPMLRVISIALISFGLLFLASASKLRPLAGTIALIVAYGLDLLGNIQVGELATRGLLYAWLFVGTPAGVSFVVNLVLAPAPRRAAERAIAQRLEASARLLRQPEDPVASELRTYVQEGNGPILSLLKFAKIEKSAPAADLECLRQATASSWTVANAVDALRSRPQETLSNEVRAQIADTLEEMAVILRRGGYPVDVSMELPQASSADALAAALVGELRTAINGFAEPNRESHADEPGEPAEHGFFAKDALTNPEHTQFALKTTAAAMFCYVLYSLLDWPSIHTAFLTCYIVAQSTAAESVEKLTLRILGCLVGAAVGIAAIVFLIPELTSVGGLMITVFVGAFGAAYIAAGSPRVSYAGFQIAFAFFLCVIQGAGPSLDMVTARDRTIGILLGNVVAYLVLTHFWPASVTRRINPALATALRRMGRITSGTGFNERHLLAAETQAALTSIDTDIALASYEPAAIRSPSSWLTNRREVVEEARRLSASLLVAADAADQTLIAEPARRLQDLLVSVTEPAAAGQHAQA